MENNQSIGNVINGVVENANVNNQIASMFNSDEDQLNRIKNLENEINSLGIRISKTESKSKINLPKWVYWIWLISIIALGISITSIFWGYNIKWNVEIVSTTIILGFVGILATFVVISNYVQVRDIENKVNSYIGGMQSIMEDVVNAQIGLCMLRAESLAGYNPIGAIYFYLHAIKTGLDYPAECGNLRDCIKDIRNILSDGISLNKKYSLKLNGESMDELIKDIQLNKNYNMIRGEFEELHLL
jgi:hypothetical protein